ncbi:hypothetical protein H0H92_005019, partial [Tricholoma furcatifolium]
KWNGHYFEQVSLFDLGLRIQLGHGGGPCPLPQAGPSEFIVVDVNGAHRVSIDYCDCSATLIHKRTQLLRSQWLPASQERPRTAFTFSVLKLYHELTLQGKTTIYDFYKTLMRRTDNNQLGNSPCRYEEFHHAFRIWRHLQMLKRGGRGHDAQGALGTSQGELAVECPACPHPGRNLPDNWDQAPLTVRWLYTLFLAMDANFKLRLKKRGLSDVDLAPGWAYYVEENAYQSHLSNYIEQPEINTCQSEHDAIARANVRNVPGHLVSGTGLILCARHALIRKNGVADLSKGERYCTMDYIALTTLLYSTVLYVVFSYDIACQWGKNLQARATDYPDALAAVTKRLEWTALVPRWHIIAHGEDCQTEHSLNYEDGVGRTCGEDVECGWSHTNQLSTSTREMGPSNRRETLDDHWGGWNWQKIVGFRTLFHKRLQEALKMREKHRDVARKLTLTFSPQKIQDWSRIINEWKLHRKLKLPSERKILNPYAEPVKVVNLQDVKRELAKEEAEQAAQGKLPAHEKIGPTEFLILGLELEEQQRTLTIEIKEMKSTKTSKQLADIQIKRTALQNRILRWRQAQIVYMPCVVALLSSTDSGESILASGDFESSLCQPEKFPLHLPSSLSPLLRSQVPELAQKEERLRFAQADDSLAEIRRHRRIISGLYQFKKFNVSGTGNRPNTRIYSLFKRFNGRINRFAARYRAAYSALSGLNPSGLWTSRFQKLEPEHICGPGKEEKDASNGRFAPSWIWLVPRLPSEDGDPEAELESEQQLEDSMRIDWAKGMARLSRWEEEVDLVLEEMRRVIVYFGWQAAWWRAKGESVNKTMDPSLRSGLLGYAERQANMFDQLGTSCAICWLPVLQKAGVEPEWKNQFVISSIGVDNDVWIDEKEDDEDNWSGDNDDEEGGLEGEIADVDFFDSDM